MAELELNTEPTTPPVSTEPTVLIAVAGASLATRHRRCPDDQRRPGEPVLPKGVLERGQVVRPQSIWVLLMVVAFRENPGCGG